MIKDLTPQDIRLNIHPGEWYFGNEYESLYTVLGSCVALSVWHPTLKIGGLCHYLLPAQPGNQNSLELQRGEGAGRYGKTVLVLMKQAMERYAALGDYQLGLFGGCDTLLNYDIGKQNILYAQRWLQDHNLTVTHTDVGGTGSRTLMLNMFSGELTLKHYAIQLGNPTINK
jgi:chemotaxis protein CheD